MLADRMWWLPCRILAFCPLNTTDIFSGHINYNKLQGVHACLHLRMNLAAEETVVTISRFADLDILNIALMEKAVGFV